MRTVKQLRDELAKFDDDALCHCYEGEVIGIVVNGKGVQGVIHCSESNDDGRDTEVPSPLARR